LTFVCATDGGSSGLDFIPPTTLFPFSMSPPVTTTAFSGLLSLTKTLVMAVLVTTESPAPFF
jgi:hypothetical protein